MKSKKPIVFKLFTLYHRRTVYVSGCFVVVFYHNLELLNFVETWLLNFMN